MLTAKQRGLFKLLEWDESRERAIRQYHREDVKSGDGVKDFTRWLTKALHRRWAAEHRRLSAPYLGD